MPNANMSKQLEKRETRKDPHFLRRERRYLSKVRLCTNLMHNCRCRWDTRCLYAHSLAELRLPDEGHNAKFGWPDIWKTKEGVHMWYGQPYSEDTHAILRWRIDLEIASEPQKVPDWAFAYAIIHMDLKPFRAPKELHWGFPQRIAALKAKRGGQLPPGVPPQLPNEMMHKLRRASQELNKPQESNLLLKLLLADPKPSLNAEEPPEEFVQVPDTAAADDSEEEVIDCIVASSEEEEDTATTAGPKETPATPPQEVLHAAGQLATWSSAGPPGLIIAPKETRRSQPKAAPQLRVTEPQKPRLLQVALNQVRKQQ